MLILLFTLNFEDSLYFLSKCSKKSPIAEGAGLFHFVCGNFRVDLKPAPFEQRCLSPHSLGNAYRSSKVEIDKQERMSASGGPRWRNNPFSRDSMSPSPGPPMSSARPLSAVLQPSPSAPNSAGHSRNHSFSPPSGSNLAPARSILQRSNSNRSSHQASSTFAPKFIKTQELEEKNEHIGGIEGENDFSGKRYVWLRDPQSAFTKGWVVDDREGGRILVQCEDGSV